MQETVMRRKWLVEDEALRAKIGQYLPKGVSLKAARLLAYWEYRDSQAVYYGTDKNPDPVAAAWDKDLHVELGKAGLAEYYVATEQDDPWSSRGSVTREREVKGQAIAQKAGKGLRWRLTPKGKKLQKTIKPKLGRRYG
jgi:hypothetical protein